MSVSGISSNSQDSALFQWLQAIKSQQATPQGSGSGNDSDGDNDGSVGGVQGTTGHPHTHRLGGLLQKIAAAVTSALEDSANQGSDPNQVIQDAIASVLNGQDTSSTANGTATDSSNTNTSDGSSGSNPLQQFAQLLQTYGVSPEQFWSDFQTAVQGVQGSAGSNPLLSALLGPGSSVDTSA
jgi:hypothetical protein